MSEYDNEGKGVLFKNDQKGNAAAPWYRGSCQINGITYDLAAWLKESKAGNKFLSLKLTEKVADPGMNRREDQPQDDGMGSDVPF